MPPSSMAADFSFPRVTIAPHQPSPTTNPANLLISKLFKLLGCAFRVPRPGGPAQVRHPRTILTKGAPSGFPEGNPAQVRHPASLGAPSGPPWPFGQGVPAQVRRLGMEWSPGPPARLPGRPSAGWPGTGRCRHLLNPPIVCPQSFPDTVRKTLRTRHKGPAGLAGNIPHAEGVWVVVSLRPTTKACTKEKGAMP